MTLLAKMVLASSRCRPHLQGIYWEATANVRCTTQEQRLTRFFPFQLDSDRMHWTFLAECGFEVPLLNHRNTMHFVLLIVPKAHLYVQSWSDFLPSQSHRQISTLRHSLWQGAPGCYLRSLETDPYFHRSTKRNEHCCCSFRLNDLLFISKQLTMKNEKI